MRQLQRMQTGMALVALLFCLTSTASWARQTQASSTASRLQTFGDEHPGALASADRLAIYPTVGKHIGDSWTIDRTSTTRVHTMDNANVFEGVQSAIDRAEVSATHPDNTAYSILFFGKGQLQRFLAVTPSGMIFDPASNHWYEASPQSLSPLLSHWQKRSAGE